MSESSQLKSDSESPTEPITKEPDQLVMYIFTNNDLGLKKSAFCPQVGHIVQRITEEIVRSGYEMFPPPPSYFTYAKWSKNCTKVVLKATLEQLLVLKEMKEARFIEDDVKTKIPGRHITVVGFFPSSSMGDIVKDYKLL